MRNVLLLPLFTLLVGCAPGATITSAPRSFDRVQVGEAWTIEYTLDGQSERGTFTVIGNARPLTCGNCEDTASFAYMEAKVTGTASGTGHIWLLNHASRKRYASFSAKRLGEFDEATCSVLLGSQADKFKADITPKGSSKSEPGSCRVLSVR